MPKPDRTPVTPSPLTAELKSNRSRNRVDSGGSNSGERTNTSYVSPSLNKVKKSGKSNKSDKSVKSDQDSMKIEVESLGSPLCRSLWDNKKCPCNDNIDCWKIDCSQCKQYWHINCVSLNGLEEDEINRLLNWLCPFCYVAPISTNDIISDSESSCMSCRNTRSLRDSNHQFEVAAAAANLKSMSKMACDQVVCADIIAQQNSIKCIEAEMKILSESCQNNLKNLSNEILQLKSEVNNLPDSFASRRTASQPSAIESHDEFLKSISERLDALTANQNFVPSVPPPNTHNIDSSPPASELIPEPLPHGQAIVSDIKHDFIDNSTSSGLIQFLETSEFQSESGHSVLAFGAPYTYTGSKSCPVPPTIPSILQPVLDKINALQTELYYEQFPSLKSRPNSAQVPLINSCLVNKYEGPSSSLPLHSDNEVTIDPESSIFTISLGESCKVKFIDQSTNISSEIECPPQSLYYMSRKSQEFYRHCIEEGSIAHGTRYSLTFRCVNWKNMNSTCLVGDSNTGLLRFGSNKRSTFGELMPGRKFWAPRISNINPQICSAYHNAVILCGINDIKQPNVTSEHEIKKLCDSLILKVKQIKQLNPKCFVYVCPLLPTKDADLNRRVNCFNNVLFRGLASMSSDVQCVQGFHGFAEHDGMLASQLSKTFDQSNRRDILHLNDCGARVLAGFIKNAIFSRLHKGVDRRRGPSSRVNGRSFSSVASGPRQPQRGGGDGYQYQVW